MNNTQEINSKSLLARSLPKRIDKILDWLERSRDGWKDKCLATKLDLKKKTLAVKRQRDGKTEWKEKAKQAFLEAQVYKKERDNCRHEIEKLQHQLELKTAQIIELKKNSCSLRKRKTC